MYEEFLSEGLEFDSGSGKFVFSLFFKGLSKKWQGFTSLGMWILIVAAHIISEKIFGEKWPFLV